MDKTTTSNVVLIGMPGCGKSTVGVLLAKRLRRYFLDTDVLIQAIEGKALHDIIAKKGMNGFCNIERMYIERVDIKNAVIATGGSVVYYPSAMQSLKANGRVVYLSLPLAELEKRLADLSKRGVVIEPNQTLSTLYKKRIPLYEQWADITVDLSGLNHDASAEALIKKIRGCDKPDT